MSYHPVMPSTEWAFVCVSHYCMLQPDSGWEVDLQHLESLVDNKTMAIVLSNPLFPTGSVYSEGHLREILAVAERHLIPIISDECELKV